MKAYNNRKYSVGLGITSACNMSCDFCYSAKRRKECIDIPISCWQDFFRKNNKYISDINFGTGENTLVDEWFNLIEFINDLDSNIGLAITTNGSLFSAISYDQRKHMILQKCITDVDVSLDYAIEEKHNRFRGHENAYQMTIDTLNYCKESNFNTTIVLMGIDDNLCIENLSGIFNIAKFYDALVRINIYRPMNSDNGLKPPSLNTILTSLDWIHENHQICSLSDPLFSAILTTTQTHRDPSGLKSIRILPDGGVYPSTYLIDENYLLGHITDVDIFNNIQNSKDLESLTTTIPSFCSNCEILHKCRGGAIDRRLLTYNTLKMPDPYCPVKHNKSFQLRDYTIKKDDFSSIHDGYLPTLFFKSNGNK